MLILSVNAYPERIVSAAPSNTEILFALGLGDKIVGVTEHCNYPPEAEEKPKVGGFYTLNIETIVSLNPDMVFATTGVQAQAVETLRDLNITVYQVDISSIDEILTEIENIGDVTGKKSEAKALVAGLHNRIDRVEDKTDELQENEKPKVYIEIWKYWTSGKNTFAYDLIKKAGGKNVFDINQGWFETNAENVINANPDVILLAYHGEDVGPEEVRSRETFELINAVKNNKIYSIGSDAIVREGPRIVDSLEEIALILHPGLMNSFSIEPTTLTLRGDLNSEVSGEFSLRNTGIDDEQITISSDIDARYDITFSQESFTLGKDESKAITVNAFIPKDEEIKTGLLGTIYITGSEYSNSLLLYLSPNNNLRIEDIDAYVDGNKDSGADENGGKIDNVLPGSTIKLNIKIKNDHEKDIKIEDITVTGTLADIEGGDIEEESDGFDLKAGKSEEVTLSFTIPLDAEEDDYELELSVEGEDENGAEYSSSVKLKVEIEKEKNSVVIISAKVHPKPVGCYRDIEISSEIINLGKDDEDVRLLISGPELGINIEENFEIEEEEAAKKDFSLNVDKDVTKGTYNIEVYAYYKDGDKSDKQAVELTVEDCEERTASNNEILLTQNQEMDEEIGNSKEKTENPDIIADAEKTNTNNEIGRIFPYALLGGVLMVLVVLICTLTIIILMKNARNKK